MAVIILTRLKEIVVVTEKKQKQQLDRRENHVGERSSRANKKIYFPAKETVRGPNSQLFRFSGVELYYTV